MTLGERIAFERKDKGISQEELANKIYIKRELLNMIENDKRVPKIDVLVDISKNLGISTDYLLGLTDVKTTDTDLYSACDYTGLSEEVVNILRSRIKEYGNIYKICLSEVISNPYFDFFLKTILGLLIYKDEHGILVNMLKAPTITIPVENTNLTFDLWAISKWQATEAGRILIENIIEEESEKNTILNKKFYTESEANRIKNYIFTQDKIVKILSGVEYEMQKGKNLEVTLDKATLDRLQELEKRVMELKEESKL